MTFKVCSNPNYSMILWYTTLIGNRVRQCFPCLFKGITELMTGIIVLLSDSAHWLELYSHSIPLTSACGIKCILEWKKYIIGPFLVKVYNKKTQRILPPIHKLSQDLGNWAQNYYQLSNDVAGHPWIVIRSPWQIIILSIHFFHSDIIEKTF